jgi:DNA-binding SARP family transcriptional activator/NAD(P)-dependent dehydrogenase (short-subunit alcohol dehydrogenase family)
MARLSLHLLGPFHVTLADTPVTGFRYDHVRALLAYLAVEADRPHRREALAGLLWPDQPDRTALENLRHALYQLQQAIGNREASPPFLLISREALQFNLDSDHLIDVALFERLTADEGGAIPLLHRERQARKQRAVVLYRGAFLQDFFLKGSNLFEEWLLRKREQLDRQMMLALRHLVQACAGWGDQAQAETYARRALDLDPWDEAMRRQLMQTLALDGRRGDALAQYDILRNLLRDEFGVGPEPETIALYARISGDQLDLPAERPTLDATPPIPSPASHTLFVGREAELRHLSGCLDEALAGRGRVTLVTGEAGGGKSALMTEFAQRAMATHAQLVVACGRCTAWAGIGDPYLPFREILQSLCGDVGAPLPNGTMPRACADRQWAIAPMAIQALATLGQSLIHRLVAAGPLGLRAELLAQQMPDRFGHARWMEQLQEIVRHPPPVGEGDARVTRADLFSQCAHVLQAIAQVQPLLLILDDLQWADAATVSLLFHLGHQVKAQSILILGAYRPEQVAMGRGEARHPLESVVNEFRQAWGECQVDLDQAEGRSFVDALLDREPNRLGAQFRETLYLHTEGHALFTTELLRSLQARGDLWQSPDLGWVEGSTLNWEKLPPRVEAAIAERIAQLPETQRAILSTASVEGDVFTAEVVARALDTDERAVVSALSHELGAHLHLVRAERLTWQGGQTLSHYRFQHHLFQRYLYQSLDTVERARLHGAVLAAMETLHEIDVDALAGALAQHAEAAGLAQRAAYYWLKAGQRAFALSAYEDAVALLRRCLATLATLPNSPERAGRELEAQLALAGPLFVARGWGAPERAETVERAYRLSLQLGESTHRLPLLVLLANLSLGRRESQRALAYAQELLPLAQASARPLFVAAGHALLGMSLLSLGRLRPAREQLEQGLTIFPREARRSASLVPGLLADVEVSSYLWLSYVLWLLGYADQADECGRKALRLAEQIDHPPTLATALGIQGIIGTLAHQIDAALGYGGQLLRLADEQGLPFARPWGQTCYGWARAMSLQAQDAICQFRNGVAALKEMGTLVGYPVLQSLLAEVYLHRGDVAEGLEAIDAALRAVEGSASRSHLAEVLRLKGELLLRAKPLGCEDGAAACFGRALEVAREQDARILALRAAHSLARLLASQGQTTEGQHMLAEVYGWFTEGFDTPDLREARRCIEELVRHRAEPNKAPPR